MSLNIPDTGKKRIIIVGGGFAGIRLVKKLCKSDYEVVLLDRNNFHKFQPLLYQVSTSALNTGDIAFPFRKLYRKKKNVHFRMTEVISIDAENHRVITGDGEARYDYLVLATGTVSNFYGMRNIESRAMTMKEIDDSLEIRNHVLKNLEKALMTPDGGERQALENLVIVGGGPTGVELAGAFAEMKRYILPKDYPEMQTGRINIYLVEGAEKLIGTMSEKTSEGTLRQLQKMGVEVILGAQVTDFTGKEAVLKNGTRIPTYNFIWTSGVRADVPKGLDKAVFSKAGRILTDQYLRVENYPDIFAAGDISWQQSEQFPNGYPQLAREAMRQGELIAKNLKSGADTARWKPYAHIEYPVLAMVGRNKAFAEYKKTRLSGFIAWMVWAGIHLVSLLGVRNKTAVLGEWFWNYLTMDKPTRLIVRAGERPVLPGDMPSEGAETPVNTTEPSVAGTTPLKQEAGTKSMSIH